ncbi:MAG: amidohydrolase [Steroidobacterales bacterium]
MSKPSSRQLDARPWILAMGAVLASLALPAPAWPSDVLYVHGHIYTALPAAPWAQALAVTGSRIDAVGSDEQILKLRRGRTRLVDLHGRTVIPGFFDSHVHLRFGAMALHGFNLSTPAESITPDKGELLVARIREYAAAHPADRILFGRADFSASPPYSPRHELLDQAVSDRPVVIHGTYEHSLWLNARALALAGITDQPVADPDEERNIIRDASGHPSGVLIESAMELMERAVQKTLAAGEQTAMLLDGFRELNRYGITSVVNASGDLAEIRRYAALRDRGELTIRIRSAFASVAVPHKLTPQFLSDLEQARSEYHDEWLAANLVKFFADGSTGQIPPLVYESGQFRAIVTELDRLGFQLMTHALRDDSVHMVLDAYAEAARANGPRDRRMRIEHADITYAADFPRFAAQSVIISMQPIFCCSETGTNYDPKERNPSDRWNTVEMSGAMLALGSDWPCAWPVDPFANIQEAVTREIWQSDDTAGVMNQPFDGAAQAGARPTGKVYTRQERISVRQAVDAYTRNAAYAAFRDTEVGTLQPGKLADLAVLSQDIFSVPGDEIGKTRVLLTVVGGRTVYEAATPP